MNLMRAGLPALAVMNDAHPTLRAVPPELALVPAWHWRQFECAGCGGFTRSHEDACDRCEAVANLLWEERKADVLDAARLQQLLWVGPVDLPGIRRRCQLPIDEGYLRIIVGVLVADGLMLEVPPGNRWRVKPAPTGRSRAEDTDR